MFTGAREYIYDEWMYVTRDENGMIRSITHTKQEAEDWWAPDIEIEWENS